MAVYTALVFFGNPQAILFDIELMGGISHMMMNYTVLILYLSLCMLFLAIHSNFFIHAC